jgi:hypothetical protein
MMNGSTEVRQLTLERIRATGATVVRIPVEWRVVTNPDPPAGFQATDPSSSAYQFAAVDAAVRETVAGGLTPLLVLSRAPAFAEAPHRWPYAYPGSWAPNPVAFGQFAAAVARRYDGSFPDPLDPGRVLPAVRFLQAWNEPNLARYLEPQWVVKDGHWRAFSPLLYRELLNAFYTAVKSVAPHDVVLSAGIAPNGEPAGIGRMTPLEFLSTMLCLTARKPKPCPDPAHFDALAFHPLSFESPDSPAVSASDVAISDIAKITGLLGRATRAHTVLPRGPKALWVTELNWESSPPAAHGVPGSLQAKWISRALHRLWIAGAKVAEWQFLIDPYPTLALATPTGGTVNISRSAGLYSAGVAGNPQSARPKPFLRGFTFPFDPLRVDRRHVRVWALLTRSRQSALLERQRASGKYSTIVRLHGNRFGVLNVLVALTGAERLRLDSGQASSAIASVPAGPSKL